MAGAALGACGRGAHAGADEWNIRGVGRLQLRCPGGRVATLGVADDPGRSIRVEVLGEQVAGSPHRVEHVGPKRAAHHVGVVARGAEPLVVSDRDGPAAPQCHRDQAGLVVGSAGEHPRRRGLIADSMRTDRIADERHSGLGPPRDQHDAGNGGRLPGRRSRAIEDSPGPGANRQARAEEGCHPLRADQLAGLSLPERVGRHVKGGTAKLSTADGAVSPACNVQQRSRRAPRSRRDLVGGAHAKSDTSFSSPGRAT